MFIKFRPLLFVSALCSAAPAATYQLSISNTITSVFNMDTGATFVATPHGRVASGSTLTLTLIYDTDAFIQTQTVAWPGGSGVQYRSSSPAVLNITVSSGYSYTGTLGGNSSAWFSLYNQDTEHDQGNYLDASGNILVQFNDFAWSTGSQTFTLNPISSLSVADAHAAFAAAVNSGAMSLANGLPGRLPGMSPSISINSSSLPTVSLLAVPEPTHSVMAATALVGLLVRRRRVAGML